MDHPVLDDEEEEAATMPAPLGIVELEIAGKVRMRIPLTTPPTLAAAIVKALGVS
jgi:transposase